MIFFLYRLAYECSDELQAPRLLALGFSLATMVLLLALTPAAWSWPARLCAPAVFATLSTYPIGDLGFSANTEIFMVFFLSLAALGVRRATAGPRAAAWSVLAGLSAGAGLMTKQTSAWTVAAFALFLAWRGEPRRKGGLCSPTARAPPSRRSFLRPTSGRGQGWSFSSTTPSGATCGTRRSS